MMSRPHYSFVLLAVLVLVGGDFNASASPDNLHPLARSAGSRAIDLSRYYPSRDAATAELDAVSHQTEAVSAAASLVGLGAYLDQTDALLGRVRRLGVYFRVLAARNIDDQAASASADRVDALEDAITGKIETTLGSLHDTSIAATLGRDPRLTRYLYLANEAAEKAGHRLPPEASRVLAAVGAPASTAYWKIYQKVDRLSLDGQEQPGPAAVNSPDRSMREAAWRARWKVAGAKADANAMILWSVVKQGEATARLKGYPDAASAGYAGRELDLGMVHGSLAAVAANLGLYRSYQRLRADRLRREAGITDPQPWDLSLLKAGSAGHFSFEDAATIVPAALAPLGSGYVEHFSALLSPSSGRVDVAAQMGNREAGGFSVNAPGVASGLYMASFDGSLNDVRVVIHEGGHAVAAQYANEGGTPSALTHGPSWLAESYALLNEMLLYDHLADTSTTEADRRFYRNALLDDMMFQVFGSAEEATLEQAIYEGVSAGRIQSAADLNDCTRKITKAFEPWDDGILDASSTLWSTKRLLFQDPFYLVNYLYAGIVAIDLYKEAKLHPDTFPDRYRALLRRGYDAPPLILLAPLLGSGQSPESLSGGAFAVMQTKLKELVAER